MAAISFTEGGACRVAGTVGLASTAVMGIADTYKGPLEPVYKAALSLGIANQLTNVLRDVGEDVQERNRIYLPKQELERFNISEAEVKLMVFRFHFQCLGVEDRICRVPLSSELRGGSDQEWVWD